MTVKGSKKPIGGCCVFVAAVCCAVAVLFFVLLLMLLVGLSWRCVPGCLGRHG